MHDSIGDGLPRGRGVRRPAALAALMSVAVLSLFAASSGLTSGGAAPAGPEAVASLAWLAGSWSGESGGLAMEEHWTTPAGGALLGMHRDVKNGRMVSFEFLRIDASGEAVTYWASPRSASPTPFRLKELGPGRRVVFENPEHDFPQRILYWRTDDDALHARVEGPATTGEKAMEWAWRPMPPAR